MTDSILGDTPPNDGREWDVQCARCGSSIEFVVGMAWVCVSGTDWCEAHPLEDRKSVRPHTCEWFTHEPKKVANG